MSCKYCGSCTTTPNISVRITERKSIALYGLGRFPVTLYKDQWQVVFAYREQIQKVISENPELPTAAERKAGRLTWTKE